MEFFAYKLDANLEGFCLTAKKKKKESEVSSLYRVVPTRKCERLKPRAGMLCRLTSLNHHMCELARRGAQLLQALLR